MPKTALLHDFSPLGRLIPDPTLSYGDLLSGNQIICGDNLPVLEMLRATHGSQIQCIYIDPPYNTGNAFTHYDDQYSHLAWLEMMRPRLSAMRDLLRETGILFCSIGDAEMAYLKVLCDEVFGRRNFVGTLIWEKKKKPSFLAQIGAVTEYILVYARDKSKASPLYHGSTTENKKYPINNAGNGVRTLNFPAGAVEFALPDQVVRPCDMSGGKIITRLLDQVEIYEGRNVSDFRLQGEWRYSQAKIYAIASAGERIHVSRLPFRPNHVRTGGRPKKMKNLLSTAHYGMATYEDATEESRKLFGSMGAFAYPKPEQLLQTLINSVTQPGDWVLDAFLGSGTTAAVAQKSGRRWIGIEAGEHAESLCVPRMKLVCDGKDGVGIPHEPKLPEGGGFVFLRYEE
jgi:adenine-specific DNA-methyltransferase